METHFVTESNPAPEVRLITMNRPEKLNAMNVSAYEHLIGALKAADADSAVRVIVLTGAGRAFCAGADVGEFAELTPDREELVAYRAQLTHDLHRTIPALAKPVMAAVNGAAVGGGCGLALACDITIASDKARFGYPEITHGLVPAVVLANLTKVVGHKAAFDLVSSGRIIPAGEAMDLDMVTRVVPHDDLMGEALAHALKLAERVPAALQATKRLFHMVKDLPLIEGLEAGRQFNIEMRGYQR